MNARCSSQSLSAHLRQEERDLDRKLDVKSLAEADTAELQQAARRQQMVEGVRKALSQVGMSASGVHRVDGEGAEGGRVVGGLYDRQKDDIALASIETLENVVDVNASSLVDATKDQVVAILTHEKRHQTSLRNAQKRGEEGLIAGALGSEGDRLFQELMASKGTEQFDAYDQERAQATALADQIGLSRGKVIQLVYEGREAEIATAARESGYASAA